MLPGRGKLKGSEFERDTGRRLSMWLTEGQRSNIFARNVLSGGSFTVTHGKGRETPNIPGDLMAASPLAFEFLSMFSIECKNNEEIDLAAFLQDKNGKSFLMKTILHTEAQAKAHGITWMVIGKRNRQETLVIMDYNIAGVAALSAASFPAAFRWHVLHNSKYFMTTLDHLLRLAPARRFITRVQTQLKLRQPNDVDTTSTTIPTNTRSTRTDRALHRRP